MSRRRLAPLALAAALPLTAVLAAEGPGEDTRAVRHDINELAWMAGCWQRTAGIAVVEEQWLDPRGGMMLGMSRTTREGKASQYEFMRIEQRGDSVIFYALPSNQAPASFPARSLTRAEVTFENPAHDFPQRIIYRNGGDSLLASIEGIQDRTNYTLPFPMARTACAGNHASGAGVGSE